MFNPLHIDAASATQLHIIYASTLTMVLCLAAIMLKHGRNAPRRRQWARNNKFTFFVILAAMWLGVLYGGSKTNHPPVVPPVIIWQERLYWDPSQERFVPALVPLKRYFPR
jgi:hypothetical protein